MSLSMEGCSSRAPISRIKIKIKRDAVRVRGMRIWVGIMKWGRKEIRQLWLGYRLTRVLESFRSWTMAGRNL